jgi:hypothetical protein
LRTLRATTPARVTPKPNLSTLWARQKSVFGTQVCVALPVVYEAVDMTALHIREREPRHDPPGLRWIIVLDCGLESLAERFRLLKLTAQPAQ